MRSEVRPSPLTCGRPFDLDPAVRRRFEKRIYVPLPDLSSRMR